ncbi:oligomycin resistance ATP-dependent permease Yor1p [[Candida] anglica]|uniref:Oligomycin resistance ATP-dependent permease Yor1p n=1 Tax=[Candida] anglica TaxID=148631 RepID=A0ABP0ENJ7_9ASCO
MSNYRSSSIHTNNSDISDTTNTFVDNSYNKEEKMNSNNSHDQMASQTNLENDGPYTQTYSSRSQSQDFENTGGLKNQKRLFSFLFSKSVPTVPSEDERKPYPWLTSNVISQTMFLWLYPILYKGYKRTLLPADLYFLQDELKVEYMHAKFEKFLNKRLDKARFEHLKTNPNTDNFKWPRYAIIIAIFETFKVQYLLSCFYLALSFCCQSLSPLLSRALVDFVEYRYFGIYTTYNRGIGLTIGSVALISLNGFFVNHFFHSAMITGAQTKAVLTKAILLKSFKMNAKAKYEFPMGKITSLMGTDLARIDLAIGYQPLIVCFPIPVIISIVLLLVNIGVTSLAGIGLFLVSLVICVAITQVLFTTRQKVSKFTDMRVGLMREVLTHIKVIKYYAWEFAYKRMLTENRTREMKHLFTIKILRNFITAYAVTLPTLTSMLSFVVLWATGKTRNAGRVFASLSLFTILAQGIMLVPFALSTGADALIGFDRCTEFLSASEDEDESERINKNEKDKLARETNSEFNFSLKENDEENPIAIEVMHADFAWEAFHDGLRSTSSWEIDEKPKSKKKAGKKFNEKDVKLPSKPQPIYNEYRNSSRSSNDTMFEPTQSIVSDNYESNVTNFPGLRDINLTIKKNEFVILTGVIGSGKSSLLSALAGVMKMSNPGIGQVHINHKLLQCAAPWIQNASVRENILFGKPFDAIKYSKIIHACCLTDDINELPGKDFTEIGERGITLSGGQKARINLARAVYSDSPILLFDDVLSAVDARVGKHIMDNLFAGYLCDRTRILATHQLSLVEKADKIAFLNGDGSIDVGTFEELQARNYRFRNLMIFSSDAKSIDDQDDSHSQGEPIKNTNRATINDRKQDTLNGRLTGDEDKATNAISWNIYKKYISLGNGMFGFAGAPLFLLVMAISTFCQVFTNTWLSFWQEKKFPGRSDNFYVAIYIMFAFLTVIFTAMEFSLLGYMNNNSARLLNVGAVEKILHTPMSFMDTNPMGRILNRFTKDTDSLDNELGEQLRLFLFPMAMIIGIIVLCICYLPWFAVAVPFLGFAFLLIADFYQGSSREIKRLEATQRSLVYNNFNETLTGLSTIKAYNAEDTFIKKNDKFINQMNEAYYLSIANQRWLGIHLDIIAAAFALIICLLCITEQFDISPESTGLLLNYVIQIVGLLSLTIRSMTQVENEMNSVERLYQYAYNLPQEAAYKKSEFTPPPEWPPSGYIQFKDVSLRYRENLPLAIKNLNFDVYPGEKIGICGRTGAGKSSIMTALYRLVELDGGSISIDGLNISELGLFDLRSRLSIIPQDPVLFQGSVRKNLDPFQEFSDEFLWDTLRRSGLIEEHELARVKSSKVDHENNLGYDSLHKFHLDQIVEDEGVNFSFGERQLIALARSMVRKPKILVLDEATSSVDYETDAKIQQTIANEFSQCTILCIAHRLKTILHYDRIMVMDQGRVIQRDTPRNLYNKAGIFRTMCEKADIDDYDFE